MCGPQHVIQGAALAKTVT